jgi:hypothetical protein
VVCHEGTRSNGGDRCCDWKPAAKKANKDIVEFSSSAKVDVSTSSSASTDDDESILETEQLEF